MKRLLIVLALTAMTVGLAEADLIVKTSTTEGKSDKVSSGTMSIGADRLEMKMDEGGKSHMSHMIYRGDKRLVWVVEGKEYYELDEATMKKMGEKVNSAMAEMEEQLAKLPEAQREMARKMFKNNPAFKEAGAATEITRESKKTGEKKTINGFPCVKYDIFEDGEKVREVWVASWKDAGIKPSDFAAFKDLGAFFEEMFSSLKSLPMMAGLKENNLATGLEDFDGVPVLTRFLDGDKVKREVSLDSIDRGDPAPGTYELSGNLKKKDFMKDM